jgi:hypothetical protein
MVADLVRGPVERAHGHVSETSATTPPMTAATSAASKAGSFATKLTLVECACVTPLRIIAVTLAMLDGLQRIVWVVDKPRIRRCSAAITALPQVACESRQWANEGGHLFGVVLSLPFPDRHECVQFAPRYACRTHRRQW